MMTKLIATRVIASSIRAAASAHAALTPGLVYSDTTLTIGTRCSGGPMALSVTVDRSKTRSSPSSITTTLTGQLEALSTGLTGLDGQIHDVFFEKQVPGTYN